MMLGFNVSRHYTFRYVHCAYREGSDAVYRLHLEPAKQFLKSCLEMFVADEDLTHVGEDTQERKPYRTPCCH